MNRNSNERSDHSRCSRFPSPSSPLPWEFSAPTTTSWRTKPNGSADGRGSDSGGNIGAGCCAGRCRSDAHRPARLRDVQLHQLDYSAMLRDVQAAESAAEGTTELSSLGVDLLLASLRMAYSHAREPDALTHAARHALKVVDQLSRHQVPAVERYRAIATTNLGFGLLWDGEFPTAETALSIGEKACRQWGLGLSALTA